MRLMIRGFRNYLRRLIRKSKRSRFSRLRMKLIGRSSSISRLIAWRRLNKIVVRRLFRRFRMLRKLRPFRLIREVWKRVWLRAKQDSKHNKSSHNLQPSNRPNHNLPRLQQHQNPQQLMRLLSFQSRVQIQNQME